VALSSGLTDLYIGTFLRQMAIHGSFSLLFVYMATLGIAPRYMGAVSALNTGTQVIGLIVFGRLADRIGRRRIFMLGFALSAVVPVVFVLASSTLGMALAYVTLGLSFSSLYIGSTAHIGDRVPKDRQGAMMGLYEMSRGGGGIIGPILAGILVPAIGYRGMFLSMAAIAGLGFLVLWFRRLDHRRRVTAKEG
jgi:MFS family permease